MKSSNDDNVTSSNDDITDDKMSKAFPITSVCRNDIIQMIEDNADANDEDELKTLMLIKKVEKITDGHMKAIASNLCDSFCDCCFWDSLKHQFERLIEGDYDKHIR